MGVSMFSYFVSFISYDEDGDPTNGCCDISTKSKISGMDSIREISELLKKEMSAIEVVIINFRLFD